MGLGLNIEQNLHIKALSTEGNLVANLEGGTIAIKGDKGDQGEKGENGKSAYEIALENGYDDTKEQWLLSLKGEKGEDGERGLDGEKGVDGITPDIEIGEVKTLQHGEKATVINSGTKEKPIFDFGLPQGEKGKDMFLGMEIIDGDLYILSNDEDNKNPFEIDEEGNLIYIIK